MYKSGQKRIDADCLSRAPVVLDSMSANDDDVAVFIGVLNVQDMVALQRSDSELFRVIEHMEGHGNAHTRVFAR